MNILTRPKAQKQPRRKHRLWKEITIILLIKTLFIFAIWKVCFSDPVEKHLTLERVQQQLLGLPTTIG